MTNKNYVKKFKGFDVPEGATHYLEFCKTEVEFYRKGFYGNLEFFNTIVPKWLEQDIKFNPKGKEELPEIPQINWNEQPSPDAVWVVDNKPEFGIMIESGWYCLSANGERYIGEDGKFYWCKVEEGYAFTVYRREDCVVESPAGVEWDGEGLPPVGTVCEYQVHASAFGECLVMGYFEEFVWMTSHHKTSPYSGSHITVNKSSLTFRPLKTQREKEREAFVEKALSFDCVPAEGMLSRTDFVAAMYDGGARFTAPKGEGDE